MSYVLEETGVLSRDGQLEVETDGAQDAVPSTPSTKRTKTASRVIMAVDRAGCHFMKTDDQTVETIS